MNGVGLGFGRDPEDEMNLRRLRRKRRAATIATPSKKPPMTSRRLVCRERSIVRSEEVGS